MHLILEKTKILINRAKKKIVGFFFVFEENRAYYKLIGRNYLGVDKQISLDVAKKTIEILNRYKLVLQNYKYDWQIIKNNFEIDLKNYTLIQWFYHGF